MISQNDRPEDNDRITQASECDRERQRAEAQSSAVKSEFLEV
jgi:hypothetical protein